MTEYPSTSMSVKIESKVFTDLDMALDFVKGLSVRNAQTISVDPTTHVVVWTDAPELAQ